MLLASDQYRNLLRRLKKQRLGKKTVVLATGVFDLLHQEHKNYLEKAKAAGDFLIVAVESDLRARALKGAGRPIHNQEQRLKNIGALPYVDAVFLLPDDFNTPEKYEQLLVELQPEIYAVSSHSPYLETKRTMIEKRGGELKVVHEHNPDVSTTKLAPQRKH